MPFLFQGGSPFGSPHQVAREKEIGVSGLELEEILRRLTAALPSD